MQERTITSGQSAPHLMESGKAGSTGERSILIVHGRDFKPAEENLLDMATAALRAGIDRDFPESLATFDSIPKDIAFYGDLTNALLKGKGEHYDQTLDLGDRSNALTALKAIEARKRFGIRQYDCLPGKSAVPEFVADVFAPILGLCGLMLPLIGRVSKDFREYLGGTTTYASQVRGRVRNKLCEHLDRGERLLLLTHGTGSVVAYDVLWQLSHDERFVDRYGSAKVDAWVTLGSPLGDYNVRKYLLGYGKRSVRTYPTNVISWHNVSAEDDYTCHDHTLADDYSGMMKEHLVSAVTDYRIFNLAVRYGRSNPHSSVGYYIHPRVAKILCDWIQATQLDISPKYIF